MFFLSSLQEIYSFAPNSLAREEEQVSRAKESRWMLPLDVGDLAPQRRELSVERHTIIAFDAVGTYGLQRHPSSPCVARARGR